MIDLKDSFGKEGKILAASEFFSFILSSEGREMSQALRFKTVWGKELGVPS